MHVRYKSLYISLSSAAKQQRKMTKFRVAWRIGTLGNNDGDAKKKMNLYFAVELSIQCVYRSQNLRKFNL